MAAQSVTGTGQGSADRYGLGPYRKTISVDDIAGPKVVISGYFEMQDTSETRNHPRLEGKAEDYVVLLKKYDPMPGGRGGTDLAPLLSFDEESTKVTVVGGRAGLQISYTVIKKGIIY